MPEEQIPILKGDKIANSLETDYRDALAVNMYAVEKPILNAAGYMICYPGLTQLATGQGVDRGAVYNERFGVQYRISGTSLISVSATGVVDILGSVSGTKQAAMKAYSFNTQCIVADGNAYLYSPSSGFSQITDPDIGTPIDVVWTSPGFYFFTDGEYLYHTNLASESTIDPLSFATAEFMPDKSLGLSLNAENKIMVWGRDSLEYFVYNAQASGFAFQRLQTRAQKIGIVATHAKVEAGNKFYIAGGRKDDAVGIHTVSTGATQKVSSREIDKVLKKYSEPELSDMRMETRTEDNVVFVLVHLPNETLCFNENIAKAFGIDSAWTILKSDVYGDTPYRGINGVNDARSGKWVYGDKQDSTIGYLDNDTCTHYGEIAEWILYTPMVKLETFSIDKVEAETIPGHTLTNDAKVAFSMSYDGLTYGKEYWINYGDKNDYHKNFQIRSLGYIRDWFTYKLRGASRSRMAFANNRITYS